MTFIVRINPSPNNYSTNAEESGTWVYVAEAEEYYLARKINVLFGDYCEENTQVHALSKKKWRLHYGGNMIENQKTVSEWATKIFGYPTRVRSIARMVEEVEELKKVDVHEAGSFESVSNECADILITLYNIADTFGFDLHACVDHKMQINRARKWKIVGDGTGQHIKE